MLNQGKAEIFPLVRDTIDEILDALDEYRIDYQHLLSFLPVLLSIVQFVNKWFLFITAEQVKFDSALQNRKQACDYTRDIILELKTVVAEFDENKNCIENLGCGDENKKPGNLGEAEQSCMPDEKFNKDLVDKPAEVQVVEAIVKKCGHLLANTSPKVRLLTVKVIVEGLSGLAQDENTLLPLVHQLWPPLVMRIVDSELQVCF